MLPAPPASAVKFVGIESAKDIGHRIESDTLNALDSAMRATKQHLLAMQRDVKRVSARMVKFLDQPREALFDKAGEPYATVAVSKLNEGT